MEKEEGKTEERPGRRHHQEEISAILSNDMEEWDQGLKKVLDRELKASDERELKFEEVLKPLEVESDFESIVDVWLRGEKNGDDNGDNGVTCLPRWTLSSQLWQ
ncbi:uncharacterized protein LOC119791750 isoform X3 [Cyprinodon tularosa]|uniref:uncharacterized protein LOC119791750 isoform X3 n=1 Tax=Cyprinodon tularosa TaxID=77115 RepID=UPI0018E1F0D6|nr:uncharacterized protein LOC119791750 isoform X3 [Cyprinodon tularosa]